MGYVVIAGASRGIGFALLKNYASDANNTVIGLARDAQSVKAKVTSELPDAKNVHIVAADLLSHKSLESARDEVSQITGGKLDVAIANAAINDDIFQHIGEAIRDDPDLFDQEMLNTFKTNVIGVSHFLALFSPLLENGSQKKAVVISSGVGDPAFVVKAAWPSNTPYGISKAAVNMAVARFQVEYAPKGIVVTSISPGIVDTGFMANADPEDPKIKKLIAYNQSLAKQYPDFKGPITPDQSAGLVHKVIDGLTFETHGGKMFSEKGTQEWL